MGASRVLDLNGLLNGESTSFDTDFFHHFFIELTGIMLFPKDSKTRDKYVAYYRSWMDSHKPIDNCQANEDVFNPFSYLEDIPIPEKQQKWIERIFLDGTMAGSLALTIYRFAEHKPKLKVGVNKARYLAEFRTQLTMTDNDKHFPIGRSRMFDSWRTFGVVSHYWATYNLLALPVADKKLEHMSKWFSSFISTSKLIRNVLLTNPDSRNDAEAIFDNDSIWDIRFHDLPKANSISIPGPTKEEIELIDKYKTPKKSK